MQKVRLRESEEDEDLHDLQRAEEGNLMIHLWHRWKTTRKGLGTAEDSWGEQTVVFEYQKCEKCRKERVKVKFVDGREMIVDPMFIEEK